MHLNDYFEFISWTETPNDKYGMIGIAEILVKGIVPIILRLKQTKAKDGGLFFCSASYTIEENGQKKYVNAAELDSRKYHAALMEFIESSVKSYKSSRQAVSSPPPIEKNYHQQSFFDAASSPSRVQEDEKLPF
jgi:hypothetical protein